MSNSLRIRTNIGDDSYIKTKLEQHFDFIEILSLKISQDDLYRKYCSDYGVVVGRVFANNGFGIPNARVSAFIPIDDVDKENIEISTLYPYEIVYDRDDNGIRYNLLPNSLSGENDCYTPIGTFPSKRQIIDNEILTKIYTKYYKFTSVTNNAGDFMLFGLPVGVYTLHIDADISDIGIVSQRPYDLISNGVSEKYFESGTKFRADKNLDSLPQVKTTNIGVNVQPFWGDLENCEIGITRVDVDLNLRIQPSAIFMGSIFGDTDKNSVNKRCTPRKDLGRLCETETSEGSIEMIRKTPDGTVEEFNVNGGRVIDSDGTWSYQIPMNLDYYVTDEFGQLIPSNDPNIGIPTRARVRFRIGMDQTGGEGRLRTRAKFLVPNNPINSQADFTFDETTSDLSFTDLYWNKIYSVKNFISRFQTFGGGNVRTFIGIKDVDSCPGNKTPFPYNRVDTNLNPLFSIVCLTTQIMVALAVVINGTLIRLLNGIISTLNSVLETIFNFIYSIGVALCTINPTNDDDVCRDGWCNGTYNSSTDECDNEDIIDYIPCMTFTCPSDDPQVYAPGCGSGEPGFTAAADNGIVIQHWRSLLTPSDNCENVSGGSPHVGHGAAGQFGAGFSDCIAASLADKMNLYTLDFYNDWVNGTLYSFLLKYKNKKNGKEKFCDYECDNILGADGDNDGNPDNKCRDNKLVDTCFTDNGTLEDTVPVDITDGLIRKVDDELYYAPVTHSGGWRLYATDIINLGAIFDCDWQGVPKLQPFLTPTTYKIPPLITEYDENGSNTDINCGMIAIGENNPDNAVFFSISCAGLSFSIGNCRNIRRQCELGVDIPTSVDTLDCTIGVNEIMDPTDPTNSLNRLARDIFYVLNVNGPSSINTPFPSTNPVLGTSINYLDPVNFGNANGLAYDQFRNYVGSPYKQPKGNSYYFYFGTEPGKTALDKMNAKYFTKCQ